MAEQTTVKMGENGRLTVPKPVRESLDIDGTETLLSLSVEVAEGDD